MAEKVAFELVSPERLLVSEPVDMVVVPGVEGDFGVKPRHSALISTLRPGVIRVYSGADVADRIFVAGGFAEVTAERCTVLAEQAVRVADLDRAKLEQEIKDLGEDVADAKDAAAKAQAEAALAIRQAMLKALG